MGCIYVLCVFGCSVLWGAGHVTTGSWSSCTLHTCSSSMIKLQLKHSGRLYTCCQIVSVLLCGIYGWTSPSIPSDFCTHLTFVSPHCSLSQYHPEFQCHSRSAAQLTAPQFTAWSVWDPHVTLSLHLSLSHLAPSALKLSLSLPPPILPPKLLWANYKCTLFHILPVFDSDFGSCSNQTVTPLPW